MWARDARRMATPSAGMPSVDEVGDGTRRGARWREGISVRPIRTTAPFRCSVASRQQMRPPATQRSAQKHTHPHTQQASERGRALTRFTRRCSLRYHRGWCSSDGIGLRERAVHSAFRHERRCGARVLGRRGARSSEAPQSCKCSALVRCPYSTPHRRTAPRPCRSSAGPRRRPARKKAVARPPRGAVPRDGCQRSSFAWPRHPSRPSRAASSRPTRARRLHSGAHWSPPS